MTGLFKTLGFAALAALLIAAPVAAQQKSAPDRNEAQIEESIRKGIENLLRALQGLVDSVPLYEMPEIQENGDIIIRRKKRDRTPEPRKPEPNGNSSST